MQFAKWYLPILVFVISGMPALSGAFDIQLTQEQIEEAKEYGAKYKGKEIFNSPVVKSACFGEYPKGDGGLVLSKYIEIAVTSSMQAANNMRMTSDEIREIEKSTAMKLVVDVSEIVENPEDVEVFLVQESNTILPLKYEFGKEKRVVQDVVCFFQYEKLNPGVKTEIIIKTGDHQRKYKINFSAIK
ncbi:MAG: hypothetical protein B6D34_11020 [Candidatus Brocadia sp. UTAMX1]|jgi:hypothetical protein|nr:MAG: hypothetical protein B6D34_11020 [Candidatus Brocadia sp. UTAMX1]